MNRRVLAITVAMVISGVILFGSQPSLAVTQVDTTPFSVNEAMLPFDALPGTSTSRDWGIANGAGWRIEVPDNWNGDLVLYAHGFRSATGPNGPRLTVDNPGIRAHLIAKGYAWAASSYRANGYVPGTGAEDTNDLLKIFRTRCATRDGKKAQTQPRVPLWLVHGRPRRRSHDREVAEQLRGGPADLRCDGRQRALRLLPGHVPPRRDPGGQRSHRPDARRLLHEPAAGLAGDTHEARTIRFRLPSRPPEQRSSRSSRTCPGATGPCIDEGFVGPSGGAFAFNFGSAVAGPGRENLDTVYQFDTDPALSPEEQQFNDTFIRLAASNQDRDRDGIFNTATSSPTLTAQFKVPVLTLHTLGELFVPFHMQQVYARRAIEAGTDDAARAASDPWEIPLRVPSRRSDDRVR